MLESVTFCRPNLSKYLILYFIKCTGYHCLLSPYDGYKGNLKITFCQIIMQLSFYLHSFFPSFRTLLLLLVSQEPLNLW